MKARRTRMSRKITEDAVRAFRNVVIGQVTTPVVTWGQITNGAVNNG